MNKTVKTAVVIIAVIIIVLAVSFAVVYTYIQKQVMDGDGMINADCYLCEYSVYGGMDGEELYISIEQINDVQAQIVYASTPYAGGQEINKSITVDIDALDKIRNIYDRYAVGEWGSLPDSEYIALDAPVTVVRFENAIKSVTISTNKELPDNATQLMSEVYNTLISYIEE